jgi:dGTPase
MEATDKLKNWMFENVYQHATVDETPQIKTVIHALFTRFMEHPELMRGREGYAGYSITDVAAGAVPDEAPHAVLARGVCDYIAGMTDRFASQTYAQLFLPSSWRGV